MEVDNPVTKNKNIEPSTQQPKKFRKFSAKEFRTLLQGDQKLIAIQGFLQQIRENTSQDCALEYLQKNGTIHELLQSMEQDSTLPPVLVFEVVNELLLKIISSKLNCRDAAYESCRYLLNTFITAVNKMLGLTSSNKERIVILKLLTTMVTFSSSLSKNILLHVNFNLTNLELLTKNTLENKTVRKHFVFFLTAMLIDIEYSTLALLLDKKGMLTSIIPGLQYDEVDTVCFILTTMRNYILENQFVSKTVKMKTFNTIVVKNIVNLYNWKGPSNLKASKKELKTSIQVDEVQKAKVSECVHDFLMILCTSHKYGVIFRDPLVGMGKKTQNALIFTVLDSMDSPWDHSYASELVIKICSACPDLTKYVWNNLKEALELRYSEKWLKVVNFVKRLIAKLQPSCLEPYVKNLNINQISQLITILVAPLPILKIMIPENCTYELQIIRYNAITLILSFSKSIFSFIEACEKWLNKEQLDKLKIQLETYVERNFPRGETLLKNWNEQDKTEESTGFNPLQYLSSVCDILECYITLSPGLLESLKFSHSDLKILLETIDSISTDSNEETGHLKIKIVDLFLYVNPSVFALTSDSFIFFLSFLLKASHQDVQIHDFRSLTVLKKFLKNTGIFDYGFEKEVNIWINGIFSLKIFNENISSFFGETIRLTHSKIDDYLKILSSIQQEIKIKNESSKYNDNLPLSPMLLGILEYSGKIDIEKNISSYINFAISNLIFFYSDITLITEILEHSTTPLINNFKSILEDDIPKKLKVFGKLDVFSKLHSALTNGSVEIFLTENEQNLSMYPDLKFDLLQMGIFYFSKLLKSNNPEQAIYAKNLTIYVDHLVINTVFDPAIILDNYSLIEHFSILDLEENGEYNSCTLFITDFIRLFSKRMLLTENNLQYFNKKIVKMLFKIIKNPKKYMDIKVHEIMEIFKMNLDTYSSIISKMCDYISEAPEKCVHNTFNTILVDSLKEFCELYNCNMVEQPFSEEMSQNLFNFFTLLNNTSEINSSTLSDALLRYLSLFPQFMKQVHADVVKSILNLKQYDKASCDLLIFILKKRKDFFTCIVENIDNLITVKGMLYPVLQMLSDFYIQDMHEDSKKEIEEIFGHIYIKFENSLHKLVRKPQKAGQHLDTNYQGLISLVEINFQMESFLEYVSKVQKFEVTKIYHAKLLNTIFKKFIDKDTDSKIICNTLLTFVHLLMNILKKIPKNEEDITEVVNTISDCFINFLDHVKMFSGSVDFKGVQSNESFKLMIKFCLKYGVSDHEKLLTILQNIITLTCRTFDEEHIKMIVEMLVSHSEFLDVVLSEFHKCKVGILSLLLTVCEQWPQVMARSHVPILLSSFGATLTESDKIALKLLKMYESASNQTSFHDFKPFLWGKTGANHYSVRSDIEKALLKQPKMRDVLNILQENIVLSTIKYYHLYHSVNGPNNLKENLIYELEFLLPLFSHLLAPENIVQTYHFTKSGALSLSILALSSEHKKMRAAACHVLARFYFHVEARQSGKDNLLWIRLIEAICRGISMTDDLVLNNFASIFLARTALILTQPNHIMYLPLSQYLAAKPALDFSSIPELYTFVYSSDVNYKDHRSFICEILCDGLITENDYTIFFRSMALKLFTELYSSCVCDMEGKLSILDVLISVCRLPTGVKFICTHNAMLEYLFMDLDDILRSSTSKKTNIALLCKLIDIFHRISSNLDEALLWEKFLISNVCKKIVDSEISRVLPESSFETLLKINK